MSADVIKLVSDLGKEFAEFKQIHSKEVNELKSTSTVSAETKAQMEAVEKKMQGLEAKIRDISTVQVFRSEEETKRDAIQLELKAMSKFLRGKEKSFTDAERKAMSTDSNVDGGYLQFDNYSAELVRKIREMSPVRQVARTFSISQGDSLTWPVQNGDVGAAWTGERANNNNSTTPTFNQLRIQVHNLLASPYVSMDTLEDAALNVESLLSELVAEQFAISEGSAFISGNGVGKPQGILTSSAVEVIDSGSNTAFTADDLMTLFYELKSGYSRNAVWMLNRETVGYVRKFKAGDDNYLLQPGLAGTAPGTILGRPYFEATDLVAPVANAYSDGDKPVLFGDFARGYYIVDKVGLGLIRDNTSQYPNVKYNFRMRVGGAVAQPEAIKILRTT